MTTLDPAAPHEVVVGDRPSAHPGGETLLRGAIDPAAPARGTPWPTCMGGLDVVFDRTADAYFDHARAAWGLVVVFPGEAADRCIARMRFFIARVPEARRMRG